MSDFLVSGFVDNDWREASYLIILLGYDKEFLGTKHIKGEENFKAFCEDIEEIAHNNIVRNKPLSQRIEAIKESRVGYFPRCGSLIDFEVVDLNSIEE